MQKMLKVSSLGFTHARRRTCHWSLSAHTSQITIIKCVVDDVLRQTWPGVDETCTFRHFRWCNLGRILNKKKNSISSRSLMNVLCLNICRLYVPNIMSLEYVLKNYTSSKLARLLDTASKFALFSVSGLKDEKLIKSKPTWKLKHANSIPESFKYFCQMSSKSIFMISCYTVSKMVSFWYTV